MNRLRWGLIALGLSVGLAACLDKDSSARRQKADNTPPPVSGEAAVKPAVLELPTKPSADEVARANNLVFEATLEAYRKLTPTELTKISDIRETLQQERLDSFAAPPLPAWVLEHVKEFEKNASDFGAAYSRSVAWGTGTYKGKTFYWFAHTNSDAWLQMDLSVALDEKDISMIYGYGRKPNDLEGAEGNPDRRLNVHLAQPVENYNPGTVTHLALKDSPEWTKEFCSPFEFERTLCDTGSAFTKYLLPVANSALPGLTFTFGGRIPQ